VPGDISELIFLRHNNGNPLGNILGRPRGSHFLDEAVLPVCLRKAENGYSSSDGPGSAGLPRVSGERSRIWPLELMQSESCWVYSAIRMLNGLR